MTITLQELVPVVPEIFILSMACVVLLIDLVLKESQRNVSYWLSQATLLGAFLLTYSLSSEGRQLTFQGLFVNDQMADVLKVFIYGIVAAVFLYSRQYLQDRALFKGEYYVLGLFAVLGMMVMVSAHSFLTIYLGLELLSLSLYALVAFNRDSSQATEAAMKYFVLGAIASGMLLYGMSILYGLSGSLDIMQVSDYLVRSRDTGQNVALLFGLSFIIVGLAFKLGAVPFHMWIPDVYHGAPTSVTLFIGTAPKIAAFAMVMRLLVEGLGELHSDWQQMLVILSVLSIAIGNVIAIAQSNIKRMLAYSTISHVGFIILGILAGDEGYAAAMFYTLVYAIMALGAFGMILLLSRKGFEAERLDDFKGLNDRNPWMAFIMLLLMFSMAGVPPTVGFYAKLAVLQAVIKVDMVWLALYAVVFTIIGAFYYLRVIKLMYFDRPVDTTPIVPQWDMRVALSTNGLLMLLLGLFPGGMMTLCAASISF
jgi:NADH-quinone oxidoreductase subunit N